MATMLRLLAVVMYVTYGCLRAVSCYWLPMLWAQQEHVPWALLHWCCFVD